MFPPGFFFQIVTLKRSLFLPNKPALAILLAMALLFAQALGLLHNIAHAGLPHGHSQADVRQEAWELALFGHAADDEHGDHHACAEYDAAAIADGIHIQSPLLVPIPSTHVLAVWHAFASWNAPLLIGFSSRAPPAA